MKHNGAKEENLERLRQRAESAVTRKPAKSAKPREHDVERLVRELEIHQAELEMQNEELRATEVALAQSRDRYYQLYDLAPVAYLTLDRSGKIHEANLTAATLLGVEQARLVGRSLLSFFGQGQVDTLYRHLGDVFESGIKLGCDLVLSVRHDGEQRETRVHLESMSLADPSGERIQCCSALIDLTGLKRADRVHRIPENGSATFQDTAADAVISSDASGQVVSFNKTAACLFGYDEAEVLGQNVRILMPSLNREGHDPYIHGYGSTDETRSIVQSNRDVIALKKDGTTFPIELRIGEWRDGDKRMFCPASVGT